VDEGNLQCDCMYLKAERWLQTTASVPQRADELRIAANGNDGIVIHQRAISEHSLYATDTGRREFNTAGSFRKHGYL
jgi:hypothetical protein